MAPTATHEEKQYLDLIREILEEGERRPDRTGTGTISIFGARLKFKLNDNGRPVLPLLTTKRVFHRAIILELLWFIQGNTSSLALSEQGVKIWDGNGSREFLDKLGLTHREVGDLGPVYGFQWRHFGAEYVDSKTDYTGQGVDQLAELIHKLRTNPYDRRMILSAWNPKDMPNMVLPPATCSPSSTSRTPQHRQTGLLRMEVMWRSNPRATCTASCTSGPAIWAWASRSTSLATRC
uniref:thymidylate synthase n=1 Tax=Bionectria ochroleuca TaxID=29856 RepID=A0A8H7NIZ0_BIOOC